MPQNADGTPHFAYYDLPNLLSFIWDGKSPVIEVSQGGYGEPVFDTIPVNGRAGISNATSIRWMDWFQLVCTNYVRLNYAENGDTDEGSDPEPGTDRGVRDR